MDDPVVQEVASFTFTDKDAGDTVWVGVTVVDSDRVGLSASLEHDGDYDVSFGSDEVSLLIKALQRAGTLLHST